MKSKKILVFMSMLVLLTMSTLQAVNGGYQ